MYAVIDIGSNTIRLSIFKILATGLELVLTKKNNAGLAQYIDDNNNMNNEGVEIAINVLKEFKMILDNISTDEIYVFATAAIRNASNSLYVANIISQNTGFNIKILTDDQEATYAFYGASKTVNVSEGIMVDLGGGSTEIVLYKDNNICYEVSIPIGSLNSFNKYIKKIVPTKKEIAQIKKVILKELKKINYREYAIETNQICAIGGSARATLKIVNHNYKLPKYNNAFDYEIIGSYLDRIEAHKYPVIKELLRIVPDRLNTILPGMIILQTICEYFNANIILVSPYGVREGYLLEQIKNK